MIATSYFIIYVNKKALCLKGLWYKDFYKINYLDEPQDDFFSDAGHAPQDGFSFLSQSARSLELSVEHSQVSQALAFEWSWS